MADAKVTVALLTRNRPQLLRLALQSILAQQGVEFDVLVLDNCSTDETPELVRSFLSDRRVSYERSESDIGIVRNWNRGIQLASARSPYVSIFHDDDIMLPGFLAESTQALSAHPSAGMSLCLAQHIHQDGSPKEIPDPDDMPVGLMTGLDFLELLVDGRAVEVPPPVLLFRSDVLKGLGPVDSPHTRGLIDMNYYARVAAVSDVVFLPKVLVQYRTHADTETSLLHRTAGGTLWYGMMSERIDMIASLLRSPRASDAAYRQWLSDRLLQIHAHASSAIQPSVPQMYHTWENRRAMAVELLERTLPAETPFILVDDGQLGINGTFGGRRVIPFIERDGSYWGPPDDSKQAVNELRRLREGGVRWLAIAWPSFWWLDQYTRFRLHLEREAFSRAETPHARVFELK